MLDISKIKAISIDLDDTLWPIWPTIERAERVLHDWLTGHAPMAAALFSSPTALREIRDYMAANRPDLKHDLSAIRRESIRLALYRAGEDPLLAERAFDVFHAERQPSTLMRVNFATTQDAQFWATFERLRDEQLGRATFSK